MKNILQNITVNSSHSITVNDTYFQALAKAQILSIYDRTTGTIIVADTDIETKLIISNGNTITTDESLPAFVEGHTILMTVDAGIVGATALAAETTAGKTLVSQAISLMGQPSTLEDSYSQMALKIKAISTEINVTPLSPSNPTRHDLATEVANFYDVENPYCLAVLFTKDVSQVYLTGAAKYKLSDGTIYTGNPGVVTFGNNTDASKKTRYVLYRNNNANISPSLTIGLGGLYYTRRVLAMLVVGCNLNAINVGGLGLNEFILDSSTEIPAIIDGTRYNLLLATGAFNSYVGCDLKLPNLRSDATVAERMLSFPTACFQNVACSNLYMPEGATSLSFSALGMFTGCAIQELVIPVGVTTLNFNGGLNASGLIYGLNIPPTLSTIDLSGGASNASMSGYFLGFYTENVLTVNFSKSELFIQTSFSSGFIFPYGPNVTINITQIPFRDMSSSITLNQVKVYNQTVATNPTSPYLTTMKLTAPLVSFTATSSLIPTTVTTLTLVSGWNFTINISGSSVLSTNATYTNVIQNLVDYRADGATTPTITADGTKSITIINGNCTKVHHTGETIYVNAVAKVIESISDDTHMTLTTTVASGSGLSYGMNKTITIHSTVKTALTAAYPTWQTDTQAKGWTVA